MSKIKLVAISVATALIVAVFFAFYISKYWQGVESTSLPKAPKISSGTTIRLSPAAPPVALFTNNMPPTIAQRTDIARLSPLATLYETSKDRRQLYDMALAQPENGGVFFASRLKQECMAWVGQGKTNADWLKTRLENIPAGQKDKVKIEAAIRRMHEPCFGFDNGTPLATPTPDQKKLDPIVSALLRLSKALEAENGTQELQSTLSEIALSRNAYALYEAMVKVGVVNSQYSVITYDGNALHPAYWEAFSIALPAAACVLGANCTGEAGGLTNLCARGTCYDDIFQYPRTKYDAATYEQFTRFHDIVAVAIVSGDFSKFGIARKPK